MKNNTPFDTIAAMGFAYNINGVVISLRTLVASMRIAHPNPIAPTRAASPAAVHDSQHKAILAFLPFNGCGL